MMTANDHVAKIRWMTNVEILADVLRLHHQAMQGFRFPFKIRVGRWMSDILERPWVGDAGPSLRNRILRIELVAAIEVGLELDGFAMEMVPIEIA